MEMRRRISFAMPLTGVFNKQSAMPDFDVFAASFPLAPSDPIVVEIAVVAHLLPPTASQGDGHLGNMDPLTILGTCVCLSQLLSSLNDIIRSVRGARKDLTAIVHELDSLQKALSVLPPEATSLPQMVDILSNCNGVMKQIRTSLRKHLKGNILTGIQWATNGKDGMVSLRSSLESHKTSILTLLGAMNFLTSTKIQAEALAQEKVQTIRYNRLVGDLADIKAILACKEQPQSRAVASIPPFRSPGRKDCSIKDIQEIIRWSKQAVNGSGNVRGLRNQRTVPLAASADRTRCPTFNPETVTGPPVVTKGGTAATAAFVNHARSEQDHNQQLRLSQMIRSGDEDLVAKRYTKALDTYYEFLTEIKDFGYQGTSNKGDEKIYRLQTSLGKLSCFQETLTRLSLCLNRRCMTYQNVSANIMGLPYAFASL
ncbi:hypothetical protein EG328_003289 [Venturia inaequalis]|uniref:Fungal N-terminal domain-containing protein n=1 Tax=Venturia inaequalis TaxID=5025 RepID=A0A8H3YVL0_VENIN|nr:hypothetical protein EG328_003289 [Venturia inaequalis]